MHLRKWLKILGIALLIYFLELLTIVNFYADPPAAKRDYFIKAVTEYPLNIALWLMPGVVITLGIFKAISPKTFDKVTKQKPRH